MSDLLVNGIVLSQSAYKDKDKLINLFTCELGKITVKLRGVFSNNAKLKLCGQPFCFGEWELVKTGDFYSLKTANIVDNFFDITSDYDLYVYASSMLEICSAILKPNIISEHLFIDLLKCLQLLTYENIQPKIVYCKFLLNVLYLTGYDIDIEKCSSCNMKFMNDVYFDLYSSSLTCKNCNSDGISLSKLQFVTLRILHDTTLDKIKTIKLNDDAVDFLINILTSNLESKINYKIKSYNLF